MELVVNNIRLISSINEKNEQQCEQHLINDSRKIRHLLPTRQQPHQKAEKVKRKLFRFIQVKCFMPYAWQRKNSIPMSISIKVIMNSFLYGMVFLAFGIFLPLVTVFHLHCLNSTVFLICI